MECNSTFIKVNLFAYLKGIMNGEKKKEREAERRF